MLVLKKTKIQIVENILITGISGQDGLFLASNYLTKKNYKIFGVTRAQNNQKIVNNIKKISGLNKFELHLDNIDLQNKDLVREYVEKIKPTTVINLSGPSSVTKSLVNKELKDNILSIFDNLINAVLFSNEEAVFIQPGSSEMFSSHGTEKLTEVSPMNPESPYAEAKYEIYNTLIEHREQRGLKVINTILFNHESEYRKEDYLFPKIISAAHNISKKKQNSLKVGSLEMIRDWSFAGDIVDAVELILEKKIYEEFVIGSGVGTSIEDVISYVFKYFELDYKKYVEVDPGLLRENSPMSIVSNPSKIVGLGWKANYNIEMLLDRCISYKINSTTP